MISGTRYFRLTGARSYRYNFPGVNGTTVFTPNVIYPTDNPTVADILSRITYFTEVNREGQAINRKSPTEVAKGKAKSYTRMPPPNIPAEVLSAARVDELVKPPTAEPGPRPARPLEMAGKVDPGKLTSPGTLRALLEETPGE